MTPAVLAFLQETKVGRMIDLASLEVEEERGVGDTELRACGPRRGRGGWGEMGEKGWPGTLLNVLFLCYSLLFPMLFPL